MRCEIAQTASKKAYIDTLLIHRTTQKLARSLPWGWACFFVGVRGCKTVATVAINYNQLQSIAITRRRTL
jgi:hypothetical protein